MAQLTTRLASFGAAMVTIVTVSAFTPSSTSSSGPTTREQTADEQVKHVLNRLAFGPRPGDVEAVRAMGVDKWIDQQLHPERIDDHIADDFIAQHFPATKMSASELMAEYPIVNAAQLARLAQRRGALTADDSNMFRQQARKAQQFAGQLQAERVARAELTQRQLQEVMTEFWLNHFNVFIGKGQPERYFLADYENTIRDHSLGKFRDLLEAVAKSPAMLFYLDNWESMHDSTRPALADASNRRVMPTIRRTPIFGRRPGTLGGFNDGMNPGMNARRDSMMQQLAARRPRGLNENYGRELLELHTLGVDGGYTQQDVINAARALTGWTIDRPRQNPEFIFRPQMHDAGDKVVLGQHLAAQRGIEDGEQLLDIVARNPNTARFIATKLVRRFVSDSAPKSLVDRAAATFTKTDGDIREVVRTIVTSDEFFSHAAYKAKVKTPFELVVSAARAVNAAPDSTPRTSQVIARLGQPIWGHRDPNGYPDVGDAWINTGSILNRINFGEAFAAARLPGANPLGFPGADALATASREQQVDGVVQAFLRGEASPDTRKILLSGVNPLASSAANAMKADTTKMDDDLAELDSTMQAMVRGTKPTKQERQVGLGRQDPLGRGAPKLEGLQQIVGLALGAPEFQRR